MMSTHVKNAVIIYEYSESLLKTCGNSTVLRQLVDTDDVTRSNFDDQSPLFMKMFYNEEINAMLTSLLTARASMTPVVTLSDLTSDPKIVFFIRVCAWVVGNVFIKLRDGHNEALKICGEMFSTTCDIIAFEMTSDRDHRPSKRVVQYMRNKKRLRKIHDRAVHTIRRTISKQRCLPGVVYDTTYVSRLCTRLKRTVDKAISIKTTMNWSRADVDLFREAQPGPNYMRRVAVHDLLERSVCKLTTGKVIALAEIMMTCVTKYPSVQQVTDFIELMRTINNVCIARSSRCFVNAVQVSCTCHTKCIGRVGGTLLEPKIWERFKVACTLQICSVCMRATNVTDMAAPKCKQLYTPTNPQLETCSNDGGLLTHLATVTLDVRVRKGVVLIHFRHLFNVINHVQAWVPRDTTSASKALCLYGMCYGGKRTCKRRFFVSSHTTSMGNMFTNQAHWSKCEDCRSNDSCTTCLSSYLSSSSPTANDVRSMCFGCKAASFCHHIDDEVTADFVSILNNDPLTGVRDADTLQCMRLKRWCKFSRALTFLRRTIISDWVDVSSSR